jgi:hypothetical protein
MAECKIEGNEFPLCLSESEMSTWRSKVLKMVSRSQKSTALFHRKLLVKKVVAEAQDGLTISKNILKD